MKQSSTPTKIGFDVSPDLIKVQSACTIYSCGNEAPKYDDKLFYLKYLFVIGV